jgi:hypothetical protein
MRFGEAMLEGYGLEMEDFFRGKSGIVAPLSRLKIVGYKRGRFGSRHHIGGAWASR